MTEVEKWMTASSKAIANNRTPRHSAKTVHNKESWLTSFLNMVELAKEDCRRIGDDSGIEDQNNRIHFQIERLEHQAKSLELEETQYNRNNSRRIIAIEGDIEELKEAIYA